MFLERSFAFGNAYIYILLGSLDDPGPWGDNAVLFFLGHVSSNRLALATSSISQPSK